MRANPRSSTRSTPGRPSSPERDLEARIAAVFDERAPLTRELGPLTERLWAGAREAAGGGKRIRARLVLAAYRGFGGDQHGSDQHSGDAALDAAVAFELLHTAFLLHDDVLDGDLVRRGRPNLIARFADDASGGTSGGSSAGTAQRWGEAAAILAGDLLIQTATSLVAGVAAPEPRRRTALAALERCVLETAAGELADVGAGLGVTTPGVEEVLAFTGLKTAPYTFSAPLVVGAALAGADEAQRAALERFGAAAGLAFQLRDDVLGVFGDERVTGKSVTSDLSAGKVTALIAFARQTGGTELDALLARGELDAAAYARIRDLLVRTGALGRVEALIAELAATARAELARPELPRRLSAELAELLDAAVERAA